MSDSLTERLRTAIRNLLRWPMELQDLCDEAAERIEELEGRLAQAGEDLVEVHRDREMQIMVNDNVRSLLAERSAEVKALEATIARFREYAVSGPDDFLQDAIRELLDGEDGQ